MVGSSLTRVPSALIVCITVAKLVSAHVQTYVSPNIPVMTMQEAIAAIPTEVIASVRSYENILLSQPPRRGGHHKNRQQQRHHRHSAGAEAVTRQTAQRGRGHHPSGTGHHAAGTGHHHFSGNEAFIAAHSAGHHRHSQRSKRAGMVTTITAETRKTGNAQMLNIDAMIVDARTYILAAEKAADNGTECATLLGRSRRVIRFCRAYAFLNDAPHLRNKLKFALMALKGCAATNPPDAVSSNSSIATTKIEAILTQIGWGRNDTSAGDGTATSTNGGGNGGGSSEGASGGLGQGAGPPPGAPPPKKCTKGAPAPAAPPPKKCAKPAQAPAPPPKKCTKGGGAPPPTQQPGGSGGGGQAPAPQPKKCGKPGGPAPPPQNGTAPAPDGGGAPPPPVKGPVPGNIVTALSTDYCPNVANLNAAASTAAIVFSTDGTCRGARVKSDDTFPRNTVFSAYLKCSQGDTSGLNQNFYLSSLEGTHDQDEIDFEFLGDKKNSVQLNYYVNGVGGHELIIMLPFDCSQDFHQYAIDYNDKAIVWKVDGNIVRVVQNDGSGPYPQKDMHLYSSVWDASFIANGGWCGTYNGDGAPYKTYLHSFATFP